MDILSFCRKIYFFCFIFWFPLYAYSGSQETNNQFSFSEDDKQRMKAIANQYRTSSSGVADSEGNNIDMLDRSNKTFGYDEKTTGALGNQTETINFSSNSSISTNARQFESTLVGSGDGSSEGRVYKLLDNHRNSIDYKDPSHDLKELSDDLTLTDDNPETNQLLQNYLDMDAAAVAGTICRNVENDPTVDTRTVVSEHFCSEQTGNIYLKTSCTVERHLTTPSVQFPESFSIEENGSSKSFTKDFYGEQEFKFIVSDKDYLNFDLDLTTSSDSVLVTLNNNIVKSYGDASENPSQYLIEGENTISISVQDENWREDEWDYISGNYYSCSLGGGVVTRVNGNNASVECNTFLRQTVLDEADFESDFESVPFDLVTKYYINIPKGYKASGKKKFNSSLIGTIKWNEWNFRTNYFSEIRRQGEMYSTAAVKCTGSRTHGSCLFGVSHEKTEAGSIAKMNTAIANYERDGSRTDNYGYAVLHTNGGRGYPLDYLDFIPSDWQGKTTVVVSFDYPKIIERTIQKPDNCVTDPSSLTVQVIGGPVLNDAEGILIPVFGSSTSPLNLSNDTWECIDSDISRINPGTLPVTITQSDYPLLEEMYPLETINPHGVCYKAQARKMLVKINNATHCDDGTWACYGADYTATENASNAWEGIVGTTSSCRDLENKSECGIQSSSCEVTNSDTGECTYTGYVYECTNEISTVTPSAASSVACTSTLPCSSGDESCNELVVDNSASFSKAASILTAANMISKEGECNTDDPNSCILFGGNEKSCRDLVTLEGVGGKDCCKNPTDFTTADGIRLALTVASSEYFQSLVTVIYDAVAQAATDLFVDLLAEQATDVAVDAATQAAIDAAANSAASAATSTTASAGASAAGSAGASAASSSVATSSTMSALSGVVSGIGAIYTAYVIAKAIYDIATQCNDGDFDASVDLGMGKCLQYDSGCTSRNGFGTCTTHKRRFCCYESAFSKHLNNEIFDKNLGGRILDASCEGLTIDEITNLDWSQITLQSWIDELSAGGIIPSTEGLEPGEFTTSGTVTAGALDEAGYEISDLEDNVSKLKETEEILTGEEYFSEENMSDLIGKVSDDPDAATASSNAEEVFSKYDGKRIEDERAELRKELLFDTLYEQYYETCGYEHFSDLNYSVQQLQRYVIDDDGNRINRRECKVYDSVSRGYMHQFEACSVDVSGGQYRASMTRFFNPDDSARIDVDYCALQNFAVTSTPCGITHHVAQGYSQSNFVLTVDSVTSGLFEASSCGYAGLDTVRYPHSVSVCDVNISPPNMLISHQTKVTIEGTTETVVACTHDQTIPLNYVECGIEHNKDGYRAMYETTYILDGQTHNNNDCEIKDGISLFQDYKYTECGTELIGDIMYTKYEQIFVADGVDEIKTSCSIIDGVSEASKLQYDSCGFFYDADKKTSQFSEYYLKDGIRVETQTCSIIDGVSITSDRGKQACGISVNTSTDTVTKSEVYLDQNCDADTSMTETVQATGSICSMTYDAMTYTLSYSIGDESNQYNTCADPLSGKITDSYSKNRGCSWGKKRKNKYREWSTQGDQVLGTYKKTGRCK